MQSAGQVEIVVGLENIASHNQCGVVALGFFDGLHLGHQSLLQQAHKIANTSTPPKKLVVYTFDRHPLEVVDPSRAPFLLTTLSEKIALVKSLPIDTLLIGKFDSSLSKLLPHEFLTQVVMAQLKPAAIAVGFNYRYGKEHQGNSDTLTQEATSLGFDVTVVEPTRKNGEIVSSTRIRTLLGEGKLREAQELLGRPYWISGKVIHGDGRGRTLGVPTANVEVDSRKLLPSLGIYAGTVCVGDRAYGGVISIGKRPTFGEGSVVVEVHLFDFDGDLYGQTLWIDLLDRRRSEEKFDSTELLIQAMQEDIAWAKATLQPFRKEGKVSK